MQKTQFNAKYLYNYTTGQKPKRFEEYVDDCIQDLGEFRLEQLVANVAMVTKIDEDEVLSELVQERLSSLQHMQMITKTGNIYRDRSESF